MEERAKEILFKIKSDFPDFNKEELLEYTKWSIIALYNNLKDENITNLNYKKDLISKLIQDKHKFRITNNIDNISVQYTELFDYIKKDNKKYIKVYCSVYFYDNTGNNSSIKHSSNKYWNDIWIVTYIDSTKTDNSKCTNCGANIKYNQFTQVYECEYCGNTVYDTFVRNWELIDIDSSNYN